MGAGRDPEIYGGDDWGRIQAIVLGYGLVNSG